MYLLSRLMSFRVHKALPRTFSDSDVAILNGMVYWGSNLSTTDRRRQTNHEGHLSLRLSSVNKKESGWGFAEQDLIHKKNKKKNMIKSVTANS